MNDLLFFWESGILGRAVGKMPVCDQRAIKTPALSPTRPVLGDGVHVCCRNRALG